MIKRLYLLTLLIYSTISSHAQVSVGYYPLQSVLSVGTNSDARVWGDLKLQSNTFYTNIDAETSIFINAKRTDLANFYCGVGARFSPFYSSEVHQGYTLSLGSRIKPLPKHRNAMILFEVSPFIDKEFDGGLLRTFLGLGYNF